MIENDNMMQIRNKVERFAAQLASWDKRIIEIIAIGSLANGDLLPEEIIELVCTFEPEPTDDSQGFFTIVNLLARDENEHISEKLDISNTIDLGFKIGEKIYLPNGVIRASPENRMTLWHTSTASKSV